MNELKSRWKDTGRDCDHCGGQIFERSDEGVSASYQTYYQCRLCGCQWSLRHELIRLGTKVQCQAVSESVVGGSSEQSRAILGWIFIAIILLFLFTRVGLVLGLMVRFAIPALFIGLIFVVLYRLGRAEEWW